MGEGRGNLSEERFPLPSPDFPLLHLVNRRTVTLHAADGELVLDGQQLTEDKARALVKSSARWSKVLLEFRPVSLLCRFVVWVIRGTPLMLQLFVVMYMPGLVFGIPMKSRMTAVLIAFVINYAAYFSEIYRGGIESIPKGQYEAGQVLGMTRSQVFFRVVLLQVVKRITPPMRSPEAE